MEKAVLDRITDGTAVLLVGEGERELTLPAAALPTGAREGDCFRLDTSCGVSLVFDPAQTKGRRQALRARLDRLRRRSGSL